MLVELSPEQMLTCHEEAVGRAEHYVQGRRKNMKDGLPWQRGAWPFASQRKTSLLACQ